ncbi:hypothetical protein M8494_15775 [Serratia ureilytica]
MMRPLVSAATSTAGRLQLAHAGVAARHLFAGTGRPRHFHRQIGRRAFAFAARWNASLPRRQYRQQRRDMNIVSSCNLTRIGQTLTQTAGDGHHPQPRRSP